MFGGFSVIQDIVWCREQIILAVQFRAMSTKIELQYKYREAVKTSSKYIKAQAYHVCNSVRKATRLTSAQDSAGLILLQKSRKMSSNPSCFTFWHSITSKPVHIKKNEYRTASGCHEKDYWPVALEKRREKHGCSPMLRSAAATTRASFGALWRGAYLYSPFPITHAILCVGYRARSILSDVDQGYSCVSSLDVCLKCGLRTHVVFIL